MQSLPFEEVAERMDRTTGAVRMLWLRAMDKLKTIYVDDEVAEAVDG